MNGLTFQIAIQALKGFGRSAYGFVVIVNSKIGIRSKSCMGDVPMGATLKGSHKV